MRRWSSHLLTSTSEELRDLYERARETRERARVTCALAGSLLMRLAWKERERAMRHARQAAALSTK
jgi:hypothetical protein